MKRYVLKYGGSNLKTHEGLLKLEDIVQHYDGQIIIVVSAFYGITSLLEKSLNTVTNDREAISELLNQIRKIHFDVLEPSIKRDKLFSMKFIELHNDLERLLLGIHYIKDVPKGLRNTVLSFGERLSSSAITEYLTFKNISCKELLPEKIPILAFGSNDFANIDIESLSLKFNEILKEKIIYVIPGFFGVNNKGKTILLGKGGTDYSAATIARASNAVSLDVIKDVQGFHTGDPRYLINTERIKQLHYKEAADLSYYGAKILHPRTIEPLVESQIPIRIFTSNNNCPEHKPLTIINDKKDFSEQIVKSVSFTDDFSIIKINGVGIGSKPGVLSKITTSLNKEGININSVITSQTTINIIINKSEHKQAMKTLSQVAFFSIESITEEKNISLIALVGNGMIENYGIASKIFSCLSSKGINIKLSSLGASDVVTFLVTDKNDRKEALETIHKEFFNSK